MKQGRKKNSAYELYGFIPRVDSGKHSAICTSCNRVLKNTAATRLQRHRNSCLAGRAGETLPLSPAIENEVNDEKNKTKSMRLKNKNCNININNIMKWNLNTSLIQMLKSNSQMKIHMRKHHLTIVLHVNLQQIKLTDMMTN